MGSNESGFGKPPCSTGLNPEMESANQFVEDYISELSKTTIDISKPLWELHLLNVKTTEAEAIAVFRIHHSLGDGTSLISLLLACTRKSADPTALPTIPENKNAVSKTARGFLPILASLWSFLLLIWNSVVDVLGFMATVVFLKDMETPIKGAAGIEFKAKRFVHRTLSLDDLKLVKNAMNSTVNDVLLGVTSAGLSRYLNRRYGEGKITEVGINNLPSGIRFRATVMVNIRPAPGIHALGEMMEKEKRDAKWGNCFGYVLLPFSIVMQDDPLDYVRQAKAISDRKKHSHEALFTFSTTALLVRSFGIKAAASATHTILSRTTMSFSNVVGPMEEISFYGHPIVYLAPTVYGPPQALIIHFQSYMNKVKMVLAVDEDVIPDPHQLCADLAESLDLIKDAVASRTYIQGLLEEEN